MGVSGGDIDQSELTIDKYQPIRARVASDISDVAQAALLTILHYWLRLNQEQRSRELFQQSTCLKCRSHSPVSVCWCVEIDILCCGQHIYTRCILQPPQVQCDELWVGLCPECCSHSGSNHCRKQFTRFITHWFYWPLQAASLISISYINVPVLPTHMRDQIISNVKQSEGRCQWILNMKMLL